MVITKLGSWLASLSAFVKTHRDPSSRPIFKEQLAAVVGPWMLVIAEEGKKNFLIGLLALTGVICCLFAAFRVRARPIPAPEKPKGRFTRAIRRYQEALKARIKTDLNEPLLVCYEHFLARCGKAFGLKEADAGAILKKIGAEHPEYYPELKRVIHTCEQVRLGLRDVNSPKAFRNAVNLFQRFEREVK